MKKITLSLLVIFLIIGCTEQQIKKRGKTFEAQINTELSKNIENETIFLGLQFGMGGEEVQNYFKELVSQEKLMLAKHEYLSDKGKIYMYKFEFGDRDFPLQNVLGTFKSYYMANKLYKLRISVEPEVETKIELLKTKLKEEYIAEYGESYITRESIYNNSEVFVWVVGNTLIEISEGLNKNILIIYTDLVAVKNSKDSPVEALMREI